MLECPFADDGTLLRLTRSGAERVVKEYQATCFDFVMNVNKKQNQAHGVWQASGGW